jgi:hypothetical protein
VTLGNERTLVQLYIVGEFLGLDVADGGEVFKLGDVEDRVSVEHRRHLRGRIAARPLIVY